MVRGKVVDEREKLKAPNLPATESIGIVGCGAISRALINAVAAGKFAVCVAGITGRTEQSAELTPEKTHEENLHSPCA